MKAKKSIQSICHLLFLYISLLGTSSSISFAQQNSSDIQLKSTQLIQLLDNQLHRLNTDAIGRLRWQAVLAPFEQQLQTLAYHPTEDCFYSIDAESAALLRISRSGTIQSLGVPRHEKTDTEWAIPFEYAVIVKGYFVTYNVSSNQLYWVCLKTNKFARTGALAFGKLYNLTYDIRENLIWTLGGDDVLYAMHPDYRVFSPFERFINLKDYSTDSRGHLWRSGTGRFFVTRNNGKQLLELNPETQLVYAWKNLLPATDGDATCITGMSDADIAEEDILEMYLEKQQKGAVMLRWTAVREWKQESYTVQYKSDNSNWINLRTIPSAGWKAYQNPYGHMLWLRKATKHQFRLLKKDRFNQIEFSRTIVLEQADQKASMLSPPVVKHQAVLIHLNNYQNQTIHYRLKDSKGQLIDNKKLYVSENDFTLNGYHPSVKEGHYYIEIISKDKVDNFKFYQLKTN